jgi:hypothetical protein
MKRAAFVLLSSDYTKLQSEFTWLIRKGSNRQVSSSRKLLASALTNLRNAAAPNQSIKQRQSLDSHEIGPQ